MIFDIDLPHQHQNFWHHVVRDIAMVVQKEQCLDWSTWSEGPCHVWLAYTKHVQIDHGNDLDPKIEKVKFIKITENI